MSSIIDIYFMAASGGGGVGSGGGSNGPVTAAAETAKLEPEVTFGGSDHRRGNTLANLYKYCNTQHIVVHSQRPCHTIARFECVCVCV